MTAPIYRGTNSEWVRLWTQMYMHRSYGLDFGNTLAYQWRLRFERYKPWFLEKPQGPQPPCYIVKEFSSHANKRI